MVGWRRAGAAALVVALASTVVVAAGHAPARAAAVSCDGAPVAPFVDRDRVAPVHRPAVDCLHHLGIVLGARGDDGRLRFSPRDGVTRAQFAGLVHRTLAATGDGDRLADVARPRFGDVPSHHTFDTEIHALAAAGVIEGVDARTFAPSRALRRDQTASLLVRTARWSTGDPVVAAAGPHFGDTVGSVHAPAIEAAFEFGLVEGTTRPCGVAGGRYAPTAPVERQQAATILARAIDRLDEIAAGEGGGRRGDPACPTPSWTPSLDAAVAYGRTRAGAVSIAVTGTDGRLVGSRADAQVAGVSTLKVLFLVAYLRHPDVRDRDLTRADRDLLEPMIRRSADEPANRIVTMVGASGLRSLADRVSMRDLVFRDPWGNSRTSARDQATFLYEVDRHVPSRHRAYALDLLTRVVPEQRWGIGEVDTGAWTAHFKGGWGSGSGAAEHQVVLLTHPSGARVSLAVMTSGNRSKADGEATLRGVFARLLADLPRR